MIKITEKFRPFSLRPGTPLILPGTTLEFRIYPSLIQVRDLTSDFSKNIEVSIQKPSLKFALFCDLERGSLFVSSEKNYKITRADNGFLVDQIFHSSPGILKEVLKEERLSLGSNKKQDIDLIWRRRDLNEILPLWFLQGNSLPDFQGEGGLLSLVKQNSLLEAYYAGFDGLSPRLNDFHHYGFSLPNLELNSNPLTLLKKGADLIRSLFVTSSKHEIALFTNFVCGKMTHVSVLDGDATFFFEWTKHKPFKVMIQAKKNCSFSLALPKEIKDFRRRHSLNERGDSASNPSDFTLEKDQILILDRFTK